MGQKSRIELQSLLSPVALAKTSLQAVEAGYRADSS